MKKIIRGVCVGLGCFAMGLGILGMALPILPTTPFFLLSAALFARGSARFHRWFTHTGLYRNYLAQTFHEKALPWKKKAFVLGTVSTLMMLGILFSPVWYARLILGVILVFHYYYFLFRIRTVTEERVGKTENRKR